jgi:S-adenosylmethionine-diacylglycerol 3-amino-3-carboxypropyl transferase
LPAGRNERSFHPNNAQHRCPLKAAAAKLVQKFDQKVFDAIYSRSLVYNACWEDPAVDRRALALGPHDTVLVITSAGCNALDYALLGPRRIHAVDANPRQTALLELKLAGIRRLGFDDFFAAFGAGRHPRFRELYHDALRAELSGFSRQYFDRNWEWFCQPDARDTFYHFGLSGMVARGFRGYLRLRPKLRDALEALMLADSLDEQRALYDDRVAPLLWGKHVSWTLSRQLTMSLLGVPRPQRKEVERQHADGIPGFVREAVGYVARELPLRENYFWQLYFRGGHTRDCCPAYLTPDGFAALKGGLADRIATHTTTVTEFLRSTEERISRYVLLDHMDWMSSYYPEALAEEWDAILDRAAPGARVLFRSAHAWPAYIDTVEVLFRGRLQRLTSLARFHPEWARELSRHDRVHTYAGFHIADLPAEGGGEGRRGP